MSDFRTRPNFVGGPLNDARMMNETISAPPLAGSSLARPEESLLQRVANLECRLTGTIEALEKIGNELTSRISHLQQVLGV